MYSFNLISLLSKMQTRGSNLNQIIVYFLLPNASLCSSTHHLNDVEEVVLMRNEMLFIPSFQNFRLKGVTCHELEIELIT